MKYFRISGLAKLALASCVFLTPLNTAASVFKCTNPAGSVTYQSAPCDANNTEARISIHNHTPGNYPDATKNARTPSVVLYSTAWCSYCKKVRKLFSDNNITYRELDIETSASAKKQYDKLNGKGVPLTTIDGTVIRGYQAEKLLRLAAPPEQ